MASSKVFEENEEINRLAVQNRLLKDYEQPVCQRVIGGRHNLKLLDIGCNDGSKTADRFTCENITQVIGLEYHRHLAKKAQKTYGNNGFAFYQCDVEGAGFIKRLRHLMAKNSIEAFDIIHISFVLMHLKNPGELLTSLRDVLTPGGKLFLVEADDSFSKVSSDTNHLYRNFLKILSDDPFSGDRNCGGKLPALLEKSGYKQIQLESTCIGADQSERLKKKDMFDIFCSYLPADMILLQKQEPDNTQYIACVGWLNQHYHTLKELFLAENTSISMGVSIITCLGE